MIVLGVNGVKVEAFAMEGQPNAISLKEGRDSGSPVSSFYRFRFENQNMFEELVSEGDSHVEFS